MKQQQSLITTGLAGLTLLLALWVIYLNSSNRTLQRSYQETLAAEQQKKSPEVDKGKMTQQIGTNIIRDMGEAALKNDKIKELLKKQGIEVRPNATPVPAADTGSKPDDKPADKPADK